MLLICVVLILLSIHVYSFQFRPTLFHKQPYHNHNHNYHSYNYITTKLNMKIIGLTGGICSGKSTVSNVLSSLGVSVIDADKVGHEVYQPDTICYNKLVE